MRTHHGIGLMTEACNRLAANYAFLSVYNHIIMINVCECCVNYIKKAVKSVLSRCSVRALRSKQTRISHCFDLLLIFLDLN